VTSRLRVVGYNVRDLLDDRDAVAHVVRSCRPDVLCLQEAPRRPGTLRRTVRLARETGLRQVSGGRSSGGTAVLVSPRLDVLTAAAARLPVAHWWTRTRGYALAELRLPDGAEVTVVSVHLPLDVADRVDHGARVRERVAGLADRPLVVSGDLNEEPGGPSWDAFGDLCRDAVELGVDDPAVVDAPTYPARSPHRRIDAVLVSPGVRVLALRPAGAADGLTHADLVAASDHLPLVADLELRDPTLRDPTAAR
jgi:endonuclease/exonuclease/phosphatase family metal-dependent hydrolase